MATEPTRQALSETSKFSSWQILEQASLFTHSCIAALLTAFALMTWLYLAKDDGGLFTIGIFLTGGAGGVLSNYFRIKGNKDFGDDRFKTLRNTVDPNLVVQVYISVIIGGMLAWAGHLLFSSGMVTNDLTPHYEDAKYLTIKDIFEVKPKHGTDALKSLFWALVFGFSEKLIPNIIDDYASILLKKEPAPTPQPTPSPPPNSSPEANE